MKHAMMMTGLLSAHAKKTSPPNHDCSFDAGIFHLTENHTVAPAASITAKCQKGFATWGSSKVTLKCDSVGTPTMDPPRGCEEIHCTAASPLKLTQKIGYRTTYMGRFFVDQKESQKWKGTATAECGSRKHPEEELREVHCNKKGQWKLTEPITCSQDWTVYCNTDDMKVEHAWFPREYYMLPYQVDPLDCKWGYRPTEGAKLKCDKNAVFTAEGHCKPICYINPEKYSDFQEVPETLDEGESFDLTCKEGYKPYTRDPETPITVRCARGGWNQRVVSHVRCEKIDSELRIDTE